MQDKRPPVAPGLGPFLQGVLDRLDGLSHEELRSLLLQHARQLSVEDRASFLAMLERPLPAAEEDDRSKRYSDPTLLEDIISFIDELRGGGEPEQVVLDSDLDWEEERGDAAWVSSFDELFERASKAFLNGNRVLAAEAFENLLYAFRRDEGFSGAEDPEDMVAADLPEAKARYLRALYEVTPPPHRARKLVQEVAALQWVGARRVELADIMDADVVPLPGLDAFLPLWLAALADAKEAGSFGWEPERRRLIREAAVLQGGISALGDLARSEGADHPEAFHEWVARLHDEGRIDEAIKAAREGTERIRSAHERARLADCLAQLASRKADSSLLLHARREAWRTDPTHKRLCAYACAQKPTIDKMIERMAAEAEAIRHGERKVDERLAAQVYMLAADYDGVLSVIENATSRGWSRDQHPAPVVVPFLVVAGSGNTTPRSDTVLWLIRQGLGRDMVEAEDGETSILLEFGQGAPTVERADAQLPVFKDLVLDVLSTHPPTEAQRNAFLARARVVIERRIRAVVLGKHLGAYGRSARLFAAWIEAKIIAGDEEEAVEFMLSIRQAFSRYRTFRAELASITDSSPLINEISSRYI